MENERRTSSGKSTSGARKASGTKSASGKSSLKSSAERRRRRRKRIIIRRILTGLALLVLLAIGITAGAFIKNENIVTLSINDGEILTVQYGDQASLPEVTAFFQGTIFNKKGYNIDVKQEGEVDWNVIGSYPVTYSASKGGASATATCTVNVVDTQPPVINLVTKENYFTAVGMPYVEEGYNAIDNYDGDITAQVVATEADGVVTYTVTDSNGNTATATRTINYTDKLVYLTFDDGPGQYTEQLLDILKQYDAKVTFFVTNQFPKYIDLLTREAAEGHTVAIHSYTHDFASIYSSNEAFWVDIKQMGDVIQSLTGQNSTLFRFPGGSGNSASRKYCEGVMTTLVTECTSRGYQYVDWNVNSGDADGVTDPNEIAQNVIAGLQNHGISIVLQHDIKQASVEAIAQILEWGKANGYVFLPLTDSSWLYHGPTIRN